MVRASVDIAVVSTWKNEIPLNFFDFQLRIMKFRTFMLMVQNTVKSVAILLHSIFFVKF